ncbi:hypothetical protein SUDANB121_02465 [Nocardiopsis dassonvillei]|uniref:hypothetical protein n=1 Tax=Nocardiopsis dassonvillei TaxID=2014 RepID=UPI003F57C12E
MHHPLLPTARTRRRPLNPHPTPVDEAPKPGATIARIFIFMPFLGFAVVLLSALGIGDVLTRLDYETASATAPGTVVEIDRGRPVVAFTAADGTEVTAIARGEYRHGDPLDVTVRYLPEDPWEAMVGDALWVPPLLFAVPLVPVAVFLLLRHPNGPRAQAYRARVRARERGRAPEGAFSPPVVLWAVSGTVFTVCALVLIATSLYGFDTWDDGQLFPVLGVVGSALLPPGLDMLFQGRLRYLERVPAGREPVPPRLFRSGFYMALLGAACTAPIILLVFVSTATDVETPEEGTATVLAAGCGDVVGNARGCRDLVALEYEVDGLRYTQTTDDVGFDFAPGDEALVAWDADDPSLVRVEGAP